LKNIKLLVASLAVVSILSSFSSKADAGQFGVVDLNKVVDNYSKAQEVTADLKMKEAELQKFLDDAQNKIKAAASPVEKKGLESKLGEQFNIKRSAYAKEQTEKWQVIEDDIYKTIEDLTKQKKFEMVFSKPGVVIGGTDITEEVIKSLNKTPSSGTNPATNPAK
jgi:Skp family chaperone for outer membrane proteins